VSQIDLQWFAAEDEGKTEEPSEYKLRKAREEGRLAKSQELNGTLVFFVTVIMLILLAPWIERKCEEVLTYFFRNVAAPKVDDKKFAFFCLKYFIIMTLPIALVGMIAGIVSNLIQNKGFLFTTKTIMPKFDKIVPHFGRYLKRSFFSVEGVFNIFKSIFKVAIIVIIAFCIIRLNLTSIFNYLRTGGPRLAMKSFAGMAAVLLVICAVLLLAVGVLDYIVQRRQFRESMKMTKQEVKEEYKEMEGDPEVKSHLEQVQRAMLRQNIQKAVKEADVVITNPTHYAVALEWKRDTAELPEVTAKGEDLTAQTMKKIARDNGVPVVENRPLARGLYTDTQVGDIIPANYLKAIATVYVQIGYLDKKYAKV